MMVGINPHCESFYDESFFRIDTESEEDLENQREMSSEPNNLKSKGRTKDFTNEKRLLKKMKGKKENSTQYANIKTCNELETPIWPT
jgi:hypothetical protein